MRRVWQYIHTQIVSGETNAASFVVRDADTAHARVISTLLRHEILC